MPELIVSLKDRELQRVPILSVDTSIGRDPANDVVLDNAGVSRRHATLTWTGEAFEVWDESSTNGIFVGGSKTGRQPVGFGEEVQIGKFHLTLARKGGVPLAVLEEARGSSSGPLDPRDTMALTTGDLERLMGQLDEARAAAASDARGGEAGRGFADITGEVEVAAELREELEGYRRLAAVAGVGFFAMAALVLFYVLGS